jgi:hypothetical protein
MASLIDSEDACGFDEGNGGEAMAWHLTLAINARLLKSTSVRGSGAVVDESA